MTTNLKKSLVALIAVALIGVMALPVYADSKGKDNSWAAKIKNGVANSVFKAFGNIAGDSLWISHSNAISGITGTLSLDNGSNNNAFKSAKTAYNQAIQTAKKTFNTARQTAHNKFVSAINSATDQASRVSALKTYLTDLLTAIKQLNTADEAALQQFIDSISVIPTNQAPTANSQSVSLSENTSKVINLTGSDPQGSAITFTVIANPSHGTLSGTVPNLTYTPNTNFSGNDSFTFKVNDGSLDSNTATVSISVTNVNQAPTANGQNVTVIKNTSKAITLTGSDPENSALSFFVVTNPTHGTLSGTVPTLTYLPSTDYTGSDIFTFKVNDGILDSIPASILITVSPSN